MPFSNSFIESYDDDTLKWKSQDIINANTTQASRKFRKRWPFQKLRVSPWRAGAETEDIAVPLLVSLDCSIDSKSVAPATLRAIELQISQVLKMSIGANIYKYYHYIYIYKVTYRNRK